MFGLSSSALQWLGAGALLVVAGALIRFRRWTFLLAGYDATSPVPDEVVADVAGNTVLRIGLAALALGVVVAVADPPGYLPALVEVAILVAVLRLLYRLHTYDPTTTA